MRTMQLKQTLKMAGLAALMLVGTSDIVAAETTAKKPAATKSAATTATATKESSAKKSTATELASAEAAQKAQPKPSPVPTSAPEASPLRGGRGPQPYQGEPRLFTGNIATGYKGGASFYAGGTFNKVATGFPFGVRLGLERTVIDPGDAVRAHEIFIAEDPDGEPRKRGESWDIRLDFLAPVKIMKLERTNVYFGGRYNDFEAYYEFLGGAETFDVASTHFGLGGGLETAFAMSQRVDLLVSAGVDYYFVSMLEGHDTFYRPNEDNDNAIRNYTFKDANEVINQPDVVTRIELGIGYHF